MPYRDLVNQAKHTAHALGCSALMPNADGGNTTDARVASHTLQLGQVRSGAFLRSHFKTQDHLLRKFPTEK
jgi:hypothetical protein